MEIGRLWEWKIDRGNLWKERSGKFWKRNLQECTLILSTSLERRCNGVDLKCVRHLLQLIKYFVVSI